MGILNVESYCRSQWVGPGSGSREIISPLDGAVIGNCGGAELDYAAMVEFAKTAGGNALRQMSFHERGNRLKALAVYLNERRDELYELSYLTGATKRDSQVDIDGGISTLFVFSSKGRREMPDDTIYLDGAIEQLSAGGNFLGQHVYTSKQGVGIHINAFNFPVWGMLEKLAPTLLAGMPAIVKPATQTSFLTHACFRMMIESELFPEGSFQLISGGVGDLLDHLGAQDIVSFTGSANTAQHLRGHKAFLQDGAQFMSEQDSLNATIVGPDCKAGGPDFGTAVREIVREMTTKAGQKCTAIRRIIAPESLVEPLIASISEKLDQVPVGDPRDANNKMGALVSHGQKADVLEKIKEISNDAGIVYGDQSRFDQDDGAFLSPILLHCENPDSAEQVHSVEAFGPVSTIMAYRDTSHAIELANRGQGSLVASIITSDGSVAREFVSGAGAWHGRLYFANQKTGKEATGHGAPLPHMVHGGPGRAGGGEELGGIRAVLHHMQRTAIQANPDLLTVIGNNWVAGSEELTDNEHPFRKKFGDLQLGHTLKTPYREVTMADIEHFAEFTGDTFYAHLDEEAASANPFFPGRVAHGYLLLSFAAGLFVDPAPGPVLANYGLENLRFTKPVSPGDQICVRLTAKQKTRRNDVYGEVVWDVEIFNQDNESVASYNLLTMNAH